MDRPCPRHFRFEVRLVMQTACPSKFARLEGRAADGRGELFGAEEIERELGSIEEMREIAAGHDLDVHIDRCVIHPVDSHARDFASALLAVARAIRGIEGKVPYVRTLVVEPLPS